MHAIIPEIILNLVFDIISVLFYSFPTSAMSELNFNKFKTNESTVIKIILEKNVLKSNETR